MNNNILMMLQDYESMGLKTVLIVAIIALCGVIVYMDRKNRSVLEAKDLEYLKLVHSSSEEIIKTKDEYAIRIQEVLKTLYENGEISKSMISEYQKHMPDIIVLLKNIKS